jgi:hypothetical protein
MDIEFHYYVNYIVAIKAGLFPDIAHKIAYSAQYVDDNTEEYTVLEKNTLSQYSNIVTQSLNPTLNFKEILSIFPLFHFIPGDDILRSSAVRQDGLCRHMSTIPNSTIARNCLRAAIKSRNPHWIGIASHAYADTWAHQNFTGLKDHYNSVYNTQHKNFLPQLTEHIGHTHFLHLPDSVSSTWYDYRLKDMKIENSERFIEAAKNLYKMYIKYGDSSIMCHKPKKPEVTWNQIKLDLQAVFKNNLAYLETILGPNFTFSSKRIFIMKIIGSNRSQRIELYKSLIRKYENELGFSQENYHNYHRDTWLQSSIYDISTTTNYIDDIGKNIVNDNKYIDNRESADLLCDSAQATYGSNFTNKIRDKVISMMKIYKKIYMWHNNYHLSDWYKFQEAAKKHHDYILDKVIRVMRKDIKLMKYGKVL